MRNHLEVLFKAVQLNVTFIAKVGLDVLLKLFKQDVLCIKLATHWTNLKRGRFNKFVI